MAASARSKTKAAPRVPLTFKQLLARTLPMWFMINVPVGGRNFYDVALQKAAERRAARIEAQREAQQAQTPDKSPVQIRNDE
ncbi:hypothetical protein FVE85_4163 [Porphyridium purpureum]|uniref:Uncharacterized protein n=1 Tax=Porphyridium purpureum TaxID=35688 RepID=A0A5J4YSC9_PORPP|nr:hypothetical protein FVE85_4163 [Porphyridium purpureum]|eukprot:POR6730..scf229_5